MGIVLYNIFVAGSVLSDCPKSFGSKTTEYHFNLLMALTIITSYLLMRKQ